MVPVLEPAIGVNWILRFVEDKEGMLVVPGQLVVTAGGPGPIPRGMVLG